MPKTFEKDPQDETKFIQKEEVVTNQKLLEKIASINEDKAALIYLQEKIAIGEAEVIEIKSKGVKEIKDAQVAIDPI